MRDDGNWSVAMRIDVIAWDLGGVWVPSIGEILERCFPMTGERRMTFRQLMFGEIEESVFWSRYLVGSKWEGRLDEWMDETRIREPDIDPALLRLYDRLAARGIAHGIISNNCGSWTALAMKKIGRHFEPIVISATAHALKPYRKIFQEFLRRSRKDPKDVLLIDDNPRNIAGAKVVGMRGVVFQSVEQLERDLADLLFDRSS